MIDRFIATCCQRRGIVWLVLLFVAAYGVYCWKQLPIEAYPDIADVTSQIVTQVPGLGAEEIEQQITIPLERALLGTPGMHVLRTRSLFALSLITVVFEDGSDGYFTRERLQERLASVNLPYEAKPGLDPYTSLPARTVGAAVLDRDPAPAKSTRRGRRQQFRRPDDAIHAGTRSRKTGQLRPLAGAGEGRHQRQQPQQRRQRHR